MMMEISAKKLTGGLGPAVAGERASSARSASSRPRSALSRRVLGWILPVILVAAWELGSRIGLIDTTLFSSPAQVGAELWKLTLTGELAAHLETTFMRIFAGFAIGVLAATLLGALTGYSTVACNLLDPLVQSLRSIPSMAWVPLFLLWLGIGETSKISLIALGAFFPVYLNLMNGIRNVDRKLVEAGLANGFRGLALVKTVVLPASLPAYLVGLRQGLSLGWMFVVAAEIMGASRGLGYLLIDGQTTGRPAIMITSVILFAVCGKLCDGILAAFSERWLHWQDVYKA
jgi:sulfonate transport system permease protein